MSVVQQDEKGIFVLFEGYFHAVNMDDGGLNKGDKIRASHRAGIPTIKIILSCGCIRIWGNDYAHSLGKRVESEQRKN